MFSNISFLRLFILCCAFTVSLSLLAQDRKIEQAVKHRKAAFILISTYVNRMVQTAEGSRPFDRQAMASDARTVELLSHLPWEGFVDGSAHGDTKAKDDIWLDEDKFKRYAQALPEKAAAVTAAAQSGDLARFKTSLASMRDTCNACHKAFRH